MSKKEDKYLQKSGKFDYHKWIRKNTVDEPINERLDRSTAQRMDGLHNMKAMKQMIVAAKVIQKDLYDEGFENDEILEFVVDRIRRAAF